MENNELQHHGIPGMKWGVRRYQNKDGTLTKAGQRRYNKEMEKLKEEQRVLNNKKRTQAKIDKLAAMRKKIDDEKVGMKKSNTETDKPQKKKLSEVSDAELTQRVNRMRLEQQFIDLSKSRNPDPPPQAKSFTKQFLDGAAKPAMINAGKNLLEKALINKGSELLGLNKKEAKSAMDMLKDEVAEKSLKKKKRELDDFFADAAKKDADAKAKSDADKGRTDAYNSDRSKNDKQRYDEAGERQSAGYHSGSSTSYNKTHVSSGSSFVSSNANLIPSKTSVDKGQSYVAEILGAGNSRVSSEYKRGKVYDADYRDVD